MLKKNSIQRLFLALCLITGFLARQSSFVFASTGPGSWRVIAPLNTPRRFHTQTLLPNGKMIVIGGQGIGNENYLDSIEIYNSLQNAWSYGASIPAYFEPAYHTSTLLPSGKILVAGGMNSSSYFGMRPLKETWLYDPNNNSWKKTAPMNIERGYHNAILLPSGKVFVVGGESWSCDREATAEIYDPDLDSWSQVASMKLGRINFTTNLLPSGKILVTGDGRKCDTYEILADRAEIYDPTSDVWSDVAPMHEPRFRHSATLLDSGKVLIVGGQAADWNGLSSAEIYDPAQNTWSVAPQMAIARSWHSTIKLLDGNVIVMGGNDNSTTAEEFVEGANQWRSLPSMNSSHNGIASTLLSDGQVFVSGGLDNIVEIYNPTTVLYIPFTVREFSTIW